MKRAIAAILACLILAGCADENASIAVSSESTSQTTSEATTATTQTTTPTNTTTATSAATTTAASTTAVTTAAEPEEQQPSIKEGITYESVSDGHIFVDFDYITDYDKSSVQTIPDEIAGKAVEAVKETDDYKASQRDLPEYENTGIDEYLDADGKLQPIMRYAFKEDFDNSGSDEWFLLYDIPIFSSYLPDSFQKLSVLVYTNGRDATVMTAYQGITEISLLDYGLCRQLLICGNGTYGAGCHSEIFGVKYGRAVELYKFRGVFYKQDCFIAAHGWQSIGDFMYYDTVAQEYRAIKGKDITKAELQKMDSKNSLAEIFSEYDEMSVYPYANVIGGKYYLVISDFIMDIGMPYTYENGEFVPCDEDCHVRLSRCVLINSVEDINYDEAVSSMVKPEEALKQKQAEELPSEGHIFVDFSYIEDYEGTRDIAECGEWYDMAMTALKSSEAYTTYNTTLKNEDLSVIKYHESAFATDITDYLDENGDIQPILSGAYIDDFDKNGQNECFLLLDIPQYIENPSYWITRSYLYFVNSNGIKYLNDFSNIWEISMLDYGLCRQFIIRAYGTMGADEGALLYGVVNGEVVKHYAFRGGFTKVDCFINASGWMGFGDFMYYDTVRQQYRAVAYEHIPTQTILEMDSTGEFERYYDDYEIDPNSLPWYLLVGEKYYCLWLGPSDIGTPYIYENGRFVQSTDNVRVSHGLPPIKINYDDAVSSMLSPAEAAVVYNAL